MRIWDISSSKLCRNHLLGEHRELHAIWSVLVNGKKGYSFHPETKRWKGKLRALYLKHDEIVKEMEKRAYLHNSLLDFKLASGRKKQNHIIHSIDEQIRILKGKKCSCRI